MDYLTFEKAETTILAFFGHLGMIFLQFKSMIKKYKHLTFTHWNNFSIWMTHSVTAALQSQIENTDFDHWRKRQIQTWASKYKIKRNKR